VGEVREGNVKRAVLTKQYLEDLVSVLIGIDRHNDLLRVEALDLRDGPSLPLELTDESAQTRYRCSNNLARTPAKFAHRRLR
jgi:hypothetical protein